ncbi:MAG: 16S rRNA (adenine(1518)-N(6)/adenine(1519)-N(6))-dimethyltransferase [Propionibacteriaceae bacterium]|jgi:16S rRNA (adenine1518-N6/adenine1519-N6)-dimethyltransferase|nr:16S rRNA (adenine(1518)-N(6)/adenine(1519)-N(6))-dimethyltransferase [Propionibacteriaceae bacterium]
MAEYLDATRIRTLASELDLRPSKGRGQNFLFDANTIRRIVGLAKVGPGDHVLEVGPGLGSLTVGLLHSGAQVTAVEIEHALAERLPVTMAELAPDKVKNLHVVEGDALRMGVDDLLAALGCPESLVSSDSPITTEALGDHRPAMPVTPSTATSRSAGPLAQPTTLVANLPYNISVPVILHLLATFPSIQRGLVLVQLEVADRLAAPPGSKVYGVPSAKLAWYADATRVGTVPATVFWPAPNVESGLVRFTRHDTPDVAGSCDFAQDDGATEKDDTLMDQTSPSPDRTAVFTLIDVAFSQRRKMLRSVLASRYPNAPEALAAANIDPQARGETLSIADFTRLAHALATTASCMT